MSSTETRSVDSPLGTPFVSFDQAQDYISRGSRRSMSSSRRSSISSRPSRSPCSRGSSVDSNNSGWSSQYSYSTESRGPQEFAVSTNSNKSSKHPVTVALTTNVKGSPFVIRVLLDPLLYRDRTFFLQKWLTVLHPIYDLLLTAEPIRPSVASSTLLDM